MIKRSKGKSAGKVKVTFVIPGNPEQSTVSVVGDFNDWTPGKNKLVKRNNGTRSVSVQLDEGKSYRFRYFADGDWFNDEAADAYEQGEHGSDDCILNL